MTERTFPAIRALIREMEGRSGELPDLVANAAAAIDQAIAAGAAPYLLAGVLTEGIANCVAENIPRDKRLPAAMAVLHLLNDRMLARGIV